MALPIASCLDLCTLALHGISAAEEVGFEPTEPFDSTVFKTAAFDHSATLPSSDIFFRRDKRSNIFANTPNYFYGTVSYFFLAGSIFHSIVKVMAIRIILTIPDPVLYTPSLPVTSFGRDLRNLVRDMYDTMNKANGVGLAAVQAGVLQRVLIIDLEHQGFRKGVFINPVLLESSGEQRSEEGCLSVPGLSVPLTRPKKVVVEYQNLSGRTERVEAENLFARALLHEMDHLDGKVFIDLLEPDLRLAHAEEIEKIKQGIRIEAVPS